MLQPGARLGTSAEDLLAQFRTFEGQVRWTARRASLFFFCSWGFMLAAVLGVILGACLEVIYASIFAGYTLFSAVLPSPVPTWALGMGMVPAALFLALAVLEVWKGHREVQSWALRVPESSGEARAPSDVSWVQRARRTQRLISNIKNDTDYGFIPLLIGGLFLACIFWVPMLSQTAPRVPPLLVDYGLLPTPVVALLGALFLTVRRWTRPYQTLFDRQLADLLRLSHPPVPGDSSAALAGSPQPVHVDLRNAPLPIYRAGVGWIQRIRGRRWPRMSLRSLRRGWSG
jgi:hypothetical protein